MPDQIRPGDTVALPVLSSEGRASVPTQTMPMPAAPPVRRRRQSPLPVVLATLLLLAGLLVVGDRLGEGAAENVAADRLQTELGLTTPPTVDLVGVPLLTQLATSRFGRVVIDADDVPLGTAGPSATLDHLHLDLREVRTSDGFTRAQVGQATGWARLSWPAVATLAGGVEVAFDGADASGRGKVRMAVVQKVLGSQIRAEISAVPELDTGSQTIVFRDPTVRLLGVDLPQAVGEALLEAALTPIPVTTPAGMAGTGLTVTIDGARLDLAGADLTFGT